MLRFSLFGFPVSVHWMFWVMAALLGGGINASTPREFQFLAVWMAAAFGSILIHELGHTFTQRRFGARAHIMLYAFGGLAIPDRGFTRWQGLVVSLAGPLVQIALGLVARAMLPATLQLPLGVTWFVLSFFQVSVFWGLLNLLPILPLDGGHILRALLGPRRETLCCYIGAACAAGLAVFMFTAWGSLWNTVFFGVLAWQNFQMSRGESPPSFLRP